MSGSGMLLNYTGPVNYEIIDLLLVKLKKSKLYIDLNKSIGKRVFAILVECLENIVKHSAKNDPDKVKIQPYISVRKNNGKIVIKSGNVITFDNTGELIRRLNQVNYLDKKALNALYKKKMNKDVNQEEYLDGAGLGFMLMKLRSGNNIEYNFRKLGKIYAYFESKISVDENVIRKVIHDPDDKSHMRLD